ncbi:energy-coupling factor transporter transmembrane component T [Shewanella sp.]|uniref:energy-coupling factor transporter transmembrane component T n=1 Tax=Shewanella sp. TaxID=50422 RepID=UPI003D0EE5D5
MWAKRRQPLQSKISSVNDASGLWLAASAMLMVTLLSSAAFLAPQSALLYLALTNVLLLVHGLLCRGNIGGILRYIVLQLGFTLLLYVVIHGGQQLHQGAWAVARLLLALLPGWWLTVVIKPQWIGEVLAKIMPAKWAFVVAASINLLPYMTSELRDIYQLQLLRGARIAPRQLLNPLNWYELAYCVIFPLFVQLLKLAQQTATAARSRHFGSHPQPTHWRDPRSHQ